MASSSRRALVNLKGGQALAGLALPGRRQPA